MRIPQGQCIYKDVTNYKYKLFKNKRVRDIKKPVIKKINKKLINNPVFTSESMKQCWELLISLKNKVNAEIFINTVDSSIYTDYYKIINKPMNLNIIEHKLKNNS